MGTVRQSRAMRREGPPSVRLQDRDLWLLESLGKMRFLATSQLARLGFGGSRSAANKRLRKLLDAGLIRVWVRSLAEDSIYSVSRPGAKQFSRGDGDSSSWTVPRDLDGNLEHLLVINEVRLSFALALTDGQAEISWWRSDWELRTATRGKVVPDAIFGIRWNAETSERVFALEVENRTRSPLAFVRKALRYRTLLAGGSEGWGTSDFTTLVVGRDERWLERYRLAVGNADPGIPIAFAALTAIEEQGPLGCVWKPSCGDELYSLRGLDSSPYSKEGVAVERFSGSGG
jgi:hypothetical protein